MSSLNIKPKSSEHFVVNAPALLADGTAIFITFTFAVAERELRRGIVGATLTKQSLFSGQKANVAAAIFNHPNVTRKLGGCQEGEGGAGQQYFNWVRTNAVSQSCSSVLGDFGIVAKVDQSLRRNILANYTVVHAVFADQDSLAEGPSTKPQLSASPSRTSLSSDEE
jgi:hypothetical protein